MLRTLLSCALFVGSIPADDARAGVPDAPQSGPPTSFYINVEHGLVTIRASRVSRQTLLSELARQTGLVILLEAPLEAPVNADISGLPLHAALRRLLREQNFTLEYRSPTDGAGPANSGTLWIFGSESVREAAMRPIRLGGSAADRAEEMIAAGETGDPGKLALLERGLLDADPDVRDAAVEGIADIEGEAAMAALLRARASPYTGVRAAATEFLSDRGR